MKVTIIASKAIEPKNPWDNVKYPCLIESRKGHLAIATSATLGMILIPFTEVAQDNASQWKDFGWTPVIGSRTVEFSN